MLKTDIYTSLYRHVARTQTSRDKQYSPNTCCVVKVTTLTVHSSGGAMTQTILTTVYQLCNHGAHAPTTLYSSQSHIMLWGC